MKPIEQYCVLLGAPWPLSKLIRIKLLVKADLCNKHGKADTGSILGSSESGSYASELKTTLERSCQQLCKGLNDDRPGNLLVAVPDHDAQHCIVLCPKVVPLLLKYLKPCPTLAIFIKFIFYMKRSMSFGSLLVQVHIQFLSHSNNSNLNENASAGQRSEYYWLEISLKPYGSA